MITFGLVIAAAAVALGLAMRTRLPASVLAILSGVVLQLVSAPVDFDQVRDGLLMAATFLVFAVGTAIERRPLRPYRRTAFGLTALTLLVTAGVGLLLWMALDLAAWTAVYWVLALTASSTLLAFDLLGRRERFFEPIGRMVSATALALDLLVILALSVFAALAHEAPKAIGVLAGVGGLAAAAWLLARWLAPFVMLRLGLDEEERLLFILLVLFSFAAVARWTGGALVTGAYFAGLAISRFPVGDLARGYLKSFSDFFSTIFYVMLGLVVSLPSPSDGVAEAIFVAALLLVRPFVLLPLVRRTGLTVRASIEAVTLLAQAGELAVIVAIVGIELGHVSPTMLGMVAAVVVVTTAIAPWLSSDRSTWRLTRWYPSSAPAFLAQAPSDHVLLLGCGETGAALLHGLRGGSAQVVVVDDDPGVVRSLQQQGIRVLRGDGADPQVLQAARADRAKIVVSTMRRPDDNARLLGTLHGRVVLVRVFSAPEAEQIRQLGGHPVVEAEVAAESLLSWHAELASARSWRPPASAVEQRHADA
jgi:Kef-type K+ transport system membrane component KefB